MKPKSTTAPAKGAAEPAAPAKIITAERIVITAADGTPRIELGTSDAGEPYLVLLDHRGERRISLSLGLPFSDEPEAPPLDTATIAAYAPLVDGGWVGMHSCTEGGEIFGRHSLSMGPAGRRDGCQTFFHAHGGVS
jgi:hypothetical protein